ncbi:hypothetical protein BRADI_5g15130v3 [Brachypodium distachyon]|uniref:Uncharacterized protein n=2 Tax=Brachypodium distachyon TaxID=15368 RepID=A0A2K2CHC8_BRADI|nr:hypothetical protein BRADI_5g15130v3 [Brachypodium distachyon]
MAVPVRLIPSPPTVCLSTPLLSLPPIARKPSPSSSCSGSSRARPGFRCSAANKPSPPPPEVSSSNSSSNSMAKIRSEVLSPFRSVRMFFYLAFMASAGLGSLIALTQVVPLGELRGSARLVIVAGPAEFVEESFRRSKPFLKDLMDRGVLVLPFPTDGNTPALQFDGEAEEGENEGDGIGEKSKRLWQLTPVYTSEWAKWLEEQKKLANVAPDSPVYLSLRMDGRVRGSGVGYPPWQAFVAQLPLVKGMWSGFLDGMDGRV